MRASFFVLKRNTIHYLCVIEKFHDFLAFWHFWPTVPKTAKNAQIRPKLAKTELPGPIFTRDTYYPPSSNPSLETTPQTQEFP